MKKKSTKVELVDILGGNSSAAYEELNAGFLKNRVIFFNQDIDDRLIEDVIEWIIQWNTEDLVIPKKNRNPITLFINSYGGSVYSANVLIDVIRASETPIRVVGLGFVASSAYLVYLAADERYCFKNTIFLQHDGQIGVESTTAKARDTVDFYGSMEDRIKDYIIGSTNMDESVYDSNYSREMYMYADKAKELGIVHKIIGEDIALKQVLKG